MSDKFETVIVCHRIDGIPLKAAQYLLNALGLEYSECKDRQFLVRVGDEEVDVKRIQETGAFDVTGTITFCSDVDNDPEDEIAVQDGPWDFHAGWEVGWRSAMIKMGEPESDNCEYYLKSAQRP